MTSVLIDTTGLERSMLKLATTKENETETLIAQ